MLPAIIFASSQSRPFFPSGMCFWYLGRLIYRETRTLIMTTSVRNQLHSGSTQEEKKKWSLWISLKKIYTYIKAILWNMLSQDRKLSRRNFIWKVPQSSIITHEPSGSWECLLLWSDQLAGSLSLQAVGEGHTVLCGDIWNPVPYICALCTDWKKLFSND